MKVTMITNVNGALRTAPQRIGIRTGRLRNKRISGHHQDYNIIMIDQNTEKSPGV